MRCPICDEAAPVELRASAQVTVGTVTATVEQRPVVACAPNHGASPPELVGAAMEATDAVVARARSRVLRADVCVSCGEVLAMPVRRAATSVSVTTEHLPVVTIHLDVPMTRCGGCGLDQVPSRSQEDLTVVIPALFAGTGDAVG